MMSFAKASGAGVGGSSVDNIRCFPKVSRRNSDLAQVGSGCILVSRSTHDNVCFFREYGVYTRLYRPAVYHARGVSSSRLKEQRICPKRKSAKVICKGGSPYRYPFWIVVRKMNPYKFLTLRLWSSRCASTWGFAPT